MNITVKDILQVNATVIAGILILLTISAGHLTNIVHLERAIGIFAWIMVAPFAVSAMMAIGAEFVDEKDTHLRTVRMRFSLIVLCAGFAYLLVFLGMYVIATLI